MLELTQQSLAFQQERSQLTDMLHAQHESMQQLVEETQTQEAALHDLSQHAQEADQQVRQIMAASSMFSSLHLQVMSGDSRIAHRMCSTCRIAAKYSTALQKCMHNFVSTGREHCKAFALHCKCAVHLGAILLHDIAWK